jgi:hypothetical protein
MNEKGRTPFQRVGPPFEKGRTPFEKVGTPFEKVSTPFEKGPAIRPLPALWILSVTHIPA